jgi:drug/metabolite transporter (DMT)-like permease
MHDGLRRGASEWSLLIALAVIWGTGFAFISVAVRTLPPASVVALRLAIASAVLLFVQVRRAVPVPRDKRAWARFTLLAFVGNLAPFTLISWGLQTVESGVAGIMMSTMPLCTVALAHFFVPGERLTGSRVAGFGLGFAGVLVLLGPGALQALAGDAHTVLREVALFAGAVCYAVNAVLVRRMPATPPLVLSTCTLLPAALAMLPVALVVDRPWTLSPSGASVAAAVWLGLISTALATLWFFRLIAAAGPTFFSLINFIIPPTAVLTGVVALGERLPPTAYTALALVFAGLLLGQRR